MYKPLDTIPGREECLLLFMNVYDPESNNDKPGDLPFFMRKIRATRNWQEIIIFICILRRRVFLDFSKRRKL